jgi:hypothetical protein
MKKHFISIIAAGVLIFKADTAEAMENDGDDFQVQSKSSSFKWNDYKQMDELELDDLFQDEFNKKDFVKAAWFLMRSVKNGNEDNRFYLSRINKEVIKFVEQEDLSGMDKYVSTITAFLEARVKELAQQKKKTVVLPPSQKKEHEFGEFKNIKAY